MDSNPSKGQVLKLQVQSLAKAGAHAGGNQLKFLSLSPLLPFTPALSNSYWEKYPWVRMNNNKNENVKMPILDRVAKQFFHRELRRTFSVIKEKKDVLSKKL